MPDPVRPGPGQIARQTVRAAAWPIPALEAPTDVILRVTRTTLCGDRPATAGAPYPGCAPGHEGVGVVAAAGRAIRNFRKGDAALFACAATRACRPNPRPTPRADPIPSAKADPIPCAAARYVRIPHGDDRLHPLPDAADAHARLSDLLPAALEIGVQAGGLGPRDVVAIVGAGPIGVAALLTAQFYAPARIIVTDPDPARLDLARLFGATDAVAGPADPTTRVLALTGGRGVDVAVAATEAPAALDLCRRVLAAGGRIARIAARPLPPGLLPSGRISASGALLSA